MLPATVAGAKTATGKSAGQPLFKTVVAIGPSKTNTRLVVTINSCEARARAEAPNTLCNNHVGTQRQSWNLSGAAPASAPPHLFQEGRGQPWAGALGLKCHPTFGRIGHLALLAPFLVPHHWFRMTHHFPTIVHVPVALLRRACMQPNKSSNTKQSPTHQPTSNVLFSQSEITGVKALFRRLRRH